LTKPKTVNKKEHTFATLVKKKLSLLFSLKKNREKNEMPK